MAYQRMYFKPFVGTTETIADNAITEDKIGPGAVGSSEIKDGAIAAEDIADGVITGSKIAAGSISGSKIQSGAVTPDKLSFAPLTRPLSPQVSTPEIADGAVTLPKMSAQIIGTDQIVNGAVTGAKIAPDTIDGTKIASSAVGAGEIASGAVSETKIGTDAVTKAKIKDGEVSPEKLEAIDPPADGEVFSYDEATGKGEWIPAGGGVPPVGLFRPRRIANYDFNNLSVDSIWHYDGLDLSGIVPEGAIAVKLLVVARVLSVEGEFEFYVRTNATDASQNMIGIHLTGIAGYAVRGRLIETIPIDADRLLDYLASEQMDDVAVSVVGWYI